MALTAGSLFSGIGGLDLAASMAGFDILFHVEIDEFCRKVLNKHASRYWPNATTFTDVREIGERNLPQVDCLFGGFPCQDVSVAGNRAGIVEGTRSGLWFEFRRVISELRPSVVLLENVPGILTRDGCIVIADLAAMGYVGRWGIISASDAGAPHQRERWFCVAYAEHDGHATASLKRGNGTAIRYNPQGQDSAREPAGIGSPEFVAGRGAMANPVRDGNGNTGTGRALHHTNRDSSQKERRRVIKQYGTVASSGRAAQPRLRGTTYGLPGWLDFPGWPARPGEDQHAYEPSRVSSVKTADRKTRIKALGNAVVPQVAFPLFIAIYEWLMEVQS